MGRPLNDFHGFYGQRDVVSRVCQLARGTKQLGRHFPHVLLLGPSGVGKTKFSDSLTVEIGSDRTSLLAAKSIKVVDLLASFEKLGPYDVLFIDEGHSLGEDEQQLLYRALDACELPTLNKSRLDWTNIRKIEPFTLMVATDQPGRLCKALRRRLQQLVFEPYGTLELAQIALCIAENIGVELTPQAARRLAEVAFGTPAKICSRIEILRMYEPETLRFGQEQVERVLADEGVDRNGLTLHQRRYLNCLVDSGAQTLKRLAIHLGVDPLYVAEEVESQLIFPGYVATDYGSKRTITSAGRQIHAASRPQVESMRLVEVSR